MIRRALMIGRWVVDFLFVTEKYDEEAILVFLYEFDASYAVMRRAKRIMESGKKNRGFTFANEEMRRALVVIGPTTSGKEFQNTLVHEIHHLAVAIARSLGYDLEGEGSAHLAGDSLMALSEIVCELGCEHCN